MEDDEIVEYLYNLFNNIIKRRKIPSEWKENLTTLIHKTES